MDTDHHHAALTIEVSSNGLDITGQVHDFKRHYGIKKIIGISGGADASLAAVGRVIDEAVAKLSQFPYVAILTGGTQGGVPEMAWKAARKYNMRIIGVLPQAGRKHAIPAHALDLQIFVPPFYESSAFGQESPLFAALCDGIVVIGGSCGTLIELANAFKINEKLIRPDSPRAPIYIAPIRGFSGVSETLYYYPFREQVKREVLPVEGIQDGLQAANFIIKKLNLFELEE